MKKVAIILAGGHGTRLWPLSTDEHPKPLLEIFNHRTLMQETIFRAKLFADDVLVLTSKQIDQTAREHFKKIGIPHKNVIIEPKEAGTAAAIAFAIAHAKKIYGDDSVVALLPVDHRIKNYGAFYRDMNFAVDSALKQKTIVLFGITPSFPATGYGYIKIGKKMDQADRDTLFAVSSFHEKPDEAKAKDYLKSGDHVWNSGIYIGSVGAFELALEENDPLFSWYKSLISPERSEHMPDNVRDLNFEREVVEKFAKLQSVIATFDWADIGTYDELYQSSMETDANGNAINANARTEDCKNCLIIGRSKKIIALGLDDIAIVDSPDGILVCRKSTHSQIVGQIATAESQPQHGN